MENMNSNVLRGQKMRQTGFQGPVILQNSK